MQTTNAFTNDLSNKSIAPITPSPKRKRYNRCGSIGRGSRKRTRLKRQFKDERKVTDDTATVSPHPLIQLPIPTHLTPPDIPLTLPDTSNIENVDAYLYHARSPNIKRNMAIAYVYNTIFGSPPPRDWKGRKGTVVSICKQLKIPAKKRKLVHRVLLAINKGDEVGVPYKGFAYKEEDGCSSLIK